nr:MFS transporter [Streptomyces sp. DHE17-7]
MVLLHQPAARRGRARRRQRRAPPAEEAQPGPDRLSRRRAADRRHHRDRAGHHLGRHRVRPWTSARIMELIGIGVAALVGFVFWQTKAAEPVVPLHIFRSRNFTLMSLIGFITGFVMFGATLFLPLYQQAVQGASATNSGLLLLPMLGAMLVTSMVAGRITTSTGRYKVFPLAGGALMTVGLFLLSLMDTDTSRLTSGLYMAVVGLGMGCLMQITMLVAQNSVEMKDMGVASSSTTLFRTLGSSFGVAIMGAIFNHRVQDVMSRAGRSGRLPGDGADGDADQGGAGPPAGHGPRGLPARGLLRHPRRVPAGRGGGGPRAGRGGLRQGGPAEGRGPAGGGRPLRRGRRHGDGEGTGERGGVTPGPPGPPPGPRAAPAVRGPSPTTG